MIPAPGKHWFWYSGRPFEVWFSRTDNTRERTGRRVESLTFRTLGRNRAFLQRFVDDVLQCHVRRQGVQSYLYTYNDGWDYVQGYSPRVLESVVLQPGEKEQSVYTINLTDFNDRSLMNAVNQVPANSILLFEDVDCTKGRQSRADCTCRRWIECTGGECEGKFLRTGRRHAVGTAERAGWFFTRRPASCLS
jgi:chaperone BCS1